MSTLLTAKLNAKQFSNKYLTFWYVNINEHVAGEYTISAHSTDTANTVCTFYCGKVWEDFSMLNTQMRYTYFALNSVINKLHSNNYKADTKAKYIAILENVKKSIIANSLQTAKYTMDDLLMQLSTRSKIGNEICDIVKSLESYA